MANVVWARETTGISRTDVLMSKKKKEIKICIMTSIWIMALVRIRLILENPVSVILIASRNIVCRGLRQSPEMQYLALAQIPESVNMRE